MAFAIHAGSPANRTGGARRAASHSWLTRVGVLVGLVTGLPSAMAAVLMDQIGPDGSFQQGLSNNVTQISNFYASAPQFNISVVDDFTLTESATLSGVEAALFASDNDTGFNLLAGLRVNVYSSQPGAAAVLAGDLLRVDVPVASITFTSPWTSSPLTRLAKLDLGADALALGPGTYWLSVTALNNSFQTDIGILMSSFAGAPGNHNARQIGSGLWGGGGDRALSADAALRLTSPPAAVPVPPPLTLFGAALGLLALYRRRAR